MIALEQIWGLLVLLLEFVKYDLLVLPLLLIFIVIHNFVSLVFVQFGDTLYHPELVKGSAGGIFGGLSEELMDVEVTSFLFDALQSPWLASVFEFRLLTCIVGNNVLHRVSFVLSEHYAIIFIA